MIGRMLCRFGCHAWRWVRGDFNRYHECRRCGSRTVTLGRGGYQPVNRAWLDGAR